MEHENIVLERECTERSLEAANATIIAAEAVRKFFSAEMLAEKRNLIRLQTMREELQIKLLQKQLEKE